ncbi:putative membrane protein [Wickerhamomyces ciferrii]|uniref:Membrane protein n=1 Tax=Wickerhamomyces ciferrii (strain ATCC 14091 / BCRC 22168 / CBS 111 / JCM 3599 / NBRC 0793 / NRRL Y-1031 F-60-10) TaxID=1206466 RepID=K0KI35_WICCF|nr:uncharacterized protein BN7_606 [Wickerhamomyces ciferrii]CCH41069.1 putative membrane protein [Wickerhamomyces ciferrii]
MSVTLGQVIWSAVKPIIKIYLIIGTGYFLAKRNILTVETTRNVSDIILTILLPCLVFNKVVTNIEDSDIKNVGIVCLSALLIFGTGGVFGLVTKVLTPIPSNWFGGLMAGAIFPNISDIPIAYLQTLDSGLVFNKEQGEKGIAHTCIFLTMFTLCLFNLGGFRLMEYDFRDVLNPKNDEEINIENLKKNEEQSTTHDDDDDEVLDDESDSENSSSQTIKNQNLNPIALTTENKRSNSIDQQQLKTLKQRSLQQRRRSSTRSRTSSIHRSFTNNSQHSSLQSYQRPKTTELRLLPSQNVDDIVEEYSQYPQSIIETDNQQRPLSKILTTDVGITSKDIQTSVPQFLKKYHLGILIFFIKNCLRPCSISIIISLIIAFIPWVKALFVKTTVSMPNAPDELPPLNFIMDYTSYVGAASVPFALILLGSAIGRLSLGNLKPGFWRGALLLVLLRLCIMPIIGVLWVNRLVSSGWISPDDYMLRFVIMISWGLPSMTTQIYFTAFYTPLDAEERVQMDCASLYLLLQYPILVISLPILVTYIVKVQFNM